VLGENVMVVKSGSTLYTGQVALPTQNLFAARMLRDARLYARGKKDGKVFVLRTTRVLVLVNKKDARWAMREGRERELWEGAGAPTYDHPVANALARYTGPGKRAEGIDGWIHNVPGAGMWEVMLLDPASVVEVVRTTD
jgi:hypothetical protein